MGPTLTLSTWLGCYCIVYKNAKWKRKKERQNREDTDCHWCGLVGIGEFLGAFCRQALHGGGGGGSSPPHIYAFIYAEEGMRGWATLSSLSEAAHHLHPDTQVQKAGGQGLPLHPPTVPTPWGFFWDLITYTHTQTGAYTEGFLKRRCVPEIFSMEMTAFIQILWRDLETRELQISLQLSGENSLTSTPELNSLPVELFVDYVHWPDWGMTIQDPMLSVRSRPRSDEHQLPPTHPLSSHCCHVAVKGAGFRNYVSIIKTSVWGLDILLPAQPHSLTPWGRSMPPATSQRDKERGDNVPLGISTAIFTRLKAKIKLPDRHSHWDQKSGKCAEGTYTLLG